MGSIERAGDRIVDLRRGRISSGAFGRGTGRTASAPGFGYFSMNLASPFWPQRSGLFPGFYPIVDATGGQYQGYNYLGFGAILISVVAIVANFVELRAKLVEHRELFAALICLLLFAVSHRVFVGNVKLLDLDYSWRLDQVLGVFRSSGRMFWPIFYALVLFGLVNVLRYLRPASGVAFVVACCLLQLADTNPLRVRLATLTRNDTPHLLNQSEWQGRMAQAMQVQIDPSYQCKGIVSGIAQMELQLAAAMAKRPINSVHNARLKEDAQDCNAAAIAARSGPWRDDTLYVFLTGGPNGAPAGWTPPRKSCHAFSLGEWCLGPS